jgi:ClpP class serine protease
MTTPHDPALVAPRPCTLDGELALDPSALGRFYPLSPRSGLFEMLFGLDDAPAYTVDGNGVAVVSIDGPLEQRAGWLDDGHDAVAERVGAALADEAVKAVVLKIDSPGGAVAGLFAACASIRSAADASGKPMVAHADEGCYSAAYALACCADAIHLPPTGGVGSVGVLMTVYDRTKQNETDGLNVQVIRSGTQKADGHPDIPLTDAAVSRMRARVNDLAALFAGHVAVRRGLDAGAVLALQGACLYGADAVAKGLADAVGSLDDSINTAAAMAAQRKTNMEDTKAAAALAALRATLGVSSDEELVAAIGTLRQQAARADTLTTELAAVRAQLAARDEVDKAAARDVVLAKHRARGALSPAMEADAGYMADLAPLNAASLDRVLSKLPGLPTAPVAPAVVGSVDPVATDPAAVALTPEEMEWAAQFNIKPEAALASKRLDAARKAARAV